MFFWEVSLMDASMSDTITYKFYEKNAHRIDDVSSHPFLAEPIDDPYHIRTVYYALDKRVRMNDSLVYLDNTMTILDKTYAYTYMRNIIEHPNQLKIYRTKALSNGYYFVSIRNRQSRTKDK